jgi:hypothetical protein
LRIFSSGSTGSLTKTPSSSLSISAVSKACLVANSALYF